MPLSRNKRVALIAAPVLLLGIGAAVLADDRYEHWDTIRRAEAITGGNSNRGKQLVGDYGCGGCHTIEGVPQAHGKVGPPLDGIGARAMIGGRLENKPDNLMRWIRNPQAVAPGTAMPNLGVTPEDSRDIAAFLYTRT